MPTTIAKSNPIGNSGTPVGCVAVVHVVSVVVTVCVIVVVTV